MARLKRLSSNSWMQPFRDRKTDFCLWSTPSPVAEHCEFKDGEKRLLQIQFEMDRDLTIVDWFTITSGHEIRFPVELQEIVRPKILANPDSFFTVTVLGCDANDDDDAEPQTEGVGNIKTRIGQQNFRQSLIDYWGECAVTGIDVIEILRASHIKPWSHSSPQERIDPFNGILLNPNLDSLFDKGFITFSDKGFIHISKLLSPEVASIMGITKKSRLSKIENGHKKYLAFHRNLVFKP